MFDSFSLKYKCQNCKVVVDLGHFSQSRHDLESDLGTYFDVKCKECLSVRNYHTNDVYANEQMNTNLVIAFFCIFLIISGTMIVWKMGFIATATFGIPFVFWALYKQSVDKSVTIFNRTSVSRENNYQPKNKKTLS